MASVFVLSLAAFESIGWWTSVSAGRIECLTGSEQEPYEVSWQGTERPLLLDCGDKSNFSSIIADKGTGSY